MKTPVLIAATLASVLALGTVLASDKDAKKAREHDQIREALQRGEVLPLPKILEIAQGAVAGDVLEIELENEDGVLEYEIKILTATGLVRKVEINAKSGQVLKVKDD